MITVIARHHHELSPSLHDDLGRYRHKVFIKNLGWELKTSGSLPGREYDQFDHHNTRYIVAVDPHQQVHGCARLLPTTQPYLLSEVFGFLCDQPVPRHNDTWEISRFAASRLEEGKLPMRVFWHTLHDAWRMGATEVVAVTTPALERYFLRNGVQLSRLGQPQRTHTDHVVALSFPAKQKNGHTALYAQPAAVTSLNQAYLRAGPIGTSATGYPALQAVNE
jgi:acyl homoserine lactone synthase